MTTLTEIQTQARNTLSEADLDALDAHRAKLFAAGDPLAAPLSNALAVLTLLVQEREDAFTCTSCHGICKKPMTTCDGIRHFEETNPALVAPVSPKLLRCGCWGECRYPMVPTDGYTHYFGG